MEPTVTRRLLVVLAALGAIVFGCGDFPRTGNLALLISVPHEFEVQRVDYKITGEHLIELDGTITAGAEPSSMFTRFISHVPVGKGYVVKLSAKSKDGRATCEGTGTGDVKYAATTVVHVTLACEEDNHGHISIVVAVQCPDFAVTSYTVSPLSASIGGTITVAATTSDDSDGGTPSFMWTASSGTFAMPTEKQTTYTCAVPGPATLTAAAANGPCRDSKTFTVMCGSDAGAD
jgi:hypothetical protein